MKRAYHPPGEITAGWLSALAPQTEQIGPNAEILRLKVVQTIYKDLFL
jgi:hypothetical protein